MNLSKRLLGIAIDSVETKIGLLEDEPEEYKNDLYELLDLLEEEAKRQRDY